MTTDRSTEATLKVYSLKPFNAETRLDRLAVSFVTPQRDLYVRTHGEVQLLDEATHRLKVTGRIVHELDLSVADLRARFTVRTITSSLQGAGNRRADLQKVAFLDFSQNRTVSLPSLGRCGGSRGRNAARAQQTHAAEQSAASTC